MSIMLIVATSIILWLSIMLHTCNRERNSYRKLYRCAETSNKLLQETLRNLIKESGDESTE